MVKRKVEGMAACLSRLKQRGGINTSSNEIVSADETVSNNEIVTADEIVSNNEIVTRDEIISNKEIVSNSEIISPRVVDITNASYIEFPSSDACGFWKGVKFSPDGSSILTNNDDNILRVFEDGFWKTYPHGECVCNRLFLQHAALYLFHVEDLFSYGTPITTEM